MIRCKLPARPRPKRTNLLIHPTAIINPSADIAHGVQIGPFCVIEENVSIGPGCQLASGVVIKRGTQIGRENRIEVGAVLGGAPQHLGAGQEVGEITIGDRNQIREYVTVHRAFKPGEVTRIGSDNMLMAASHMGHDCKIGDHNILANNVMLAGHVEVESRNYFGGGAALHQFCRVGSHTMIGGLAQIKRDIPPFVMVDGATACLVGLNRVGLRRSGMSVEHRSMLKDAYRLAFRSNLPFEARIERLKLEFPDDPAKQLWKFLEGGSRGFLQDRRGAKSEIASDTKEVFETVSESERNTDDRPHILPMRRAA